MCGKLLTAILLGPLLHPALKKIYCHVQIHEKLKNYLSTGASVIIMLHFHTPSQTTATLMLQMGAGVNNGLILAQTFSLD